MHASVQEAPARRWRVIAVASLALSATLVVTVGAPPAAAVPGNIDTVAGGGFTPGSNGDGGPATDASLAGPWGVDEAGGTLLIGDEIADRVRRVDAGGTISTLAGGGVIPLGDGGPATAASMNLPEGISVAADGDLLVSDERNHRVRRVDSATGVIVTVAGNGTPASSGDGGPATSASLNSPLRAVTDPGGHLFVTELSGNRVRRVTPGADGVVDGDADEVITTVLGLGGFGSDGDGGLANAARASARGLAVDAQANLYVADVGSSTIRKVAAGANGVVDGTDIVTRFAGGGGLALGADGEGAPATDVALAPPEGLAFDSSGNLYASLVGEPRIVRIDSAANVRTVAGDGVSSTPTDNGDGGPATSARFVFVFGIAVDGAGNVYIADVNEHRVRRIASGADGVVDGDPDEIITTVAGNGRAETGGDGGPGVDAQVNRPADVAASGLTTFVAEAQANRIRRIDAAGIITTVAGGGIGDGGQATAAILERPRGVVADGTGGTLVADCGHQRVRRVSGAGVITTFTGGLAPFRCPSGLHLVASGPAAGNLYVADSASHRVLRRDPSGAVTTVAGTGTAGFAGDGGAATAARLNKPTGVYVDGAGTLYVADTGNNRVRAITPAGIIATVAGNGDILWGSDGVAATSVPVAAPTDMARDAAGNLLVVESGFHRVRRVSPAGVISTITGNGIPSFLGDGGPADIALLAGPTELDLDAAGNVLVTEQLNGVVRRISGGTPPPAPTSGCGQLVTRNLTLNRDVGPCEGDGLVIGKDDITVNLNGFRVLGTDDLTDSVGIRLTGRKGVTVKGGASKVRPAGTVSGFGVGIAVIGGSRNTVEEVHVRDNLGPSSSDEATFGDGIGLFFSSDNRLVGNVVDNNGIYDGIAVLGIGASRNLISRNVVSGTNRLDDTEAFSPVGTGIVLTPFLSENLPRETSLSENRIIGNVVRDNDNSGISNISNVRGVISDNLVQDNGHSVARPANGIGIQANERANPNTQVLVTRNTVIGNGHVFPSGGATGDGINVFSSENRIVANEVHANKASGIFVRADFRAILGQRNVIRDNDAADNGSPDFNHADLFDSNFTLQFEPEFAFIEHCDHNEWFGNTWGSGGFFPNSGPFAGCSATGGQQAGAATAMTAAASAEITKAAAAQAKAAAIQGPAPEPVLKRGGPRR